MSKELEALKNIEKEVEDFEGFDENTWHQMDRTRFQIIETALKALEIIRHLIKSLGLTFLFLSEDKKILITDSSEYEYWYTCETQEEFDLLKEVLL